MHWSHSRCLPLALAVIVGFGLSYVGGSEPVEKNNKEQEDRFSGTIKLRQKQLRRDAARVPMLLEQNRQLQETIRQLRRD